MSGSWSCWAKKPKPLLPKNTEVPEFTGHQDEDNLKKKKSVKLFTFGLTTDLSWTVEKNISLWHQRKERQSSNPDIG